MKKKHFSLEISVSCLLILKVLAVGLNFQCYVEFLNSRLCKKHHYTLSYQFQIMSRQRYIIEYLNLDTQERLASGKNTVFTVDCILIEI